MHRVLIAFAAAVALFGVTVLPADAVFQTGTAQGSAISVGGDGGAPNQVDLAGDIVASYTSVAGNDTQFKTNGGGNPSVTVVSVFGDTVDVQGPSAQAGSPGASLSYILSITNWANQSDQFKIDNKGLPTGSAGDSITVRVNGTIIYDKGNDSFLEYVFGPIPAGAETQVIVDILHDTNGALGQASVFIVARANNGVGGDTAGYVGNNGVNYAGLGDDGETLSLTVNQINVALAVTQDTIQTPVSYNGPPGDTIPGSTIHYTIRYDNDGNDTAVDFRLNFKIPQFSDLADTPSVFAHTGATPSVTMTDDSGAVQPAGPNVRRVRITFSTPVAPNLGDTIGVTDGFAPDVDEGLVTFRIYIK